MILGVSAGHPFLPLPKSATALAVAYKRRFDALSNKGKSPSRPTVDGRVVTVDQSQTYTP
jgi:hypothetical protein